MRGSCVDLRIPWQGVVRCKLGAHHRRQIALDVGILATEVLLEELPGVLVVGQGRVVIPVPAGELVQQHVRRTNEQRLAARGIDQVHCREEQRRVCRTHGVRPRFPDRIHLLAGQFDGQVERRFQPVFPAELHDLVHGGAAIE
ncbi:hypothetical protein D9M72_260450 [compost metagenome]